MSYTTAVTDRTLADVQANNSKAYMNVADWTRIYENSKLVSSLAEIELGSAIAFALIDTPTTSTIPTITWLNNLTGNIEALRVAVAGESITGTTTPIKDDWEAGVNKDAPDYIDVNLWESTVDVIWSHYNGSSYDVCPTLTSNLTITTGNREIYIDCLDDGGYNIDLQGTAELFII